jgi:aminopeptidase N
VNNNNQYKNNINNNNSDSNRNHFFKKENKHTGPSPLLKGLLQKIGLHNNGGSPVVPDATEIKKEVPASMSLSDLKKETPQEIRKKIVTPLKEATEEKKASLKELLQKTINNNHENKKDTVDPFPKESLVKEPDLEIKEIKKEKEKEKEKEVEPMISNSSDLWQKHKVKKEVPEDVLRNILE